MITAKAAAEMLRLFAVSYVNSDVGNYFPLFVEF